MKRELALKRNKECLITTTVSNGVYINQLKLLSIIKLYITSTKRSRINFEDSVIQKKTLTGNEKEMVISQQIATILSIMMQLLTPHCNV